MKKIIYDSSWSGMGGIGRFSSEISKSLHGCHVEKLISSPASLCALFKLSSAMLVNKAELYVLPGYIPPLFCLSNYIFTIHDLNHIDRPENSNFFKRLFYSVFIKSGCKKASYVFTVSDFSKKRIIEWSGVSPEKIINVGNGVDPIFNPDVQPYMANFEYLLCVSNRKKHKNELGLVNAFALSNIDKKIKLLFTGHPSAELTREVSSLNLSDRVEFTGTIPDKLLPSYYRGSLGLLFPSLYEGFGLPVVEAMACGTPVLTSNTTSLPEVAGDAAILVNPQSIDDIKVGIEKIVLDQALRKELIVKGLERAKLFNWDDVAERVQAIMDEVTECHAG